MVLAQNTMGNLPTRRTLLDQMGGIRRELAVSIATILKAEYVSMTTDGWKSDVNDSYMLFSCFFFISRRSGKNTLLILTPGYVAIDFVGRF